MDEHTQNFESGEPTNPKNGCQGSGCRELDEALETASFLNLLMRLLPECSAMVPVVSLAEVAAAAGAHGLSREFERDKILAPNLLQTHKVVQVASERAGLSYDVEVDGSIVVLKGRSKSKDSPPLRVQVSSPMLICGIGYNTSHTEPCLLLKLQSETGVWNELVLPRSSLTNSGTLHSELKKMGCRTAAPTELVTLLSIVEPEMKFRTYEHTGWNGDDFVMPNGEVVSAANGGPASRATFGADAAYGTGGSKAGADDMFRTVEHDAYIVTAVGMALASPLLRDTQIVEPGTHHFYGTSTIGKTTTLCVAMSVVGKGAEQKHGGVVWSWSTTRHAAEKKISKYKDIPVALDEAQLVSSAEDFNHLAYSLANGTNKAAGNGYMGLREVETFRSIVLSTGENSAKSIIEGDARLKHTGGVALRVNDIAFEGFQVCSPEFASIKEHADYLRAMARDHYGWHFRELVRALVNDHVGSLQRIKELMREFMPSETTPQIARVQERYALFAAVIEFAIERGILPWRAGTGKAAVAAVFSAWKVSRGDTAQSHELNSAVESFSNTLFRDRHRITVLNGSNIVPPNRLAARLGNELFFTKEGLEEAVGGKANLGPFLKHLAAGECPQWGLRTEKDRQQVKCPKGRGLPDRAYCIIEKMPASDANECEDPVEFLEE
ncbi:DUF927 domain-containing protein [Hyphomicrobium sp.]|uniref:DUF927 domain-containing protein n=1 Tax=Hyphomicrobium sp. TaxID=82 RepID=UPI000FB2E73E|nr:DUF927 domain-containing protein [Hyphomicrobium sp.]RUO97675.1 MAG: DUF927 domain-containing protein [Hyphomicrobium sp.]